VIKTTTPTQRLAQVRARIQVLDAQEANIRATDAARLENQAATKPELDAALEDHKRATERLEKARTAYNSHGVDDLGSVRRLGDIARERAALQDELDGDLQPWASQ
jgi:hypothetical protein